MTSVFATIRKGFRWIWAHWYIPLFILAAIAGWLLRLRKDAPPEALTDELKGIKEREWIRRVSIERSADLANAIISSQYFDAIKEMDAEQGRKAEALRSDPARRVRYLREISKRLGKRPGRAPDFAPKQR